MNESSETTSMVSQCLSGEDIELLNVPDEEKGFELINQGTIDIILLDKEPENTEKDSFELLCQLKKDERFRHIPIIVLTTSQEPADRSLAFELGAEEYIIKPFEPVKLCMLLYAIAFRRERQQNVMKYRSLYQNPLVGIFRCDIKSGCLTDCNDRAREMLGLGTEERELHISDWYYTTADYAHLLSMLKEQESVEGYEIEMKRKDGTSVWVLLSATFFPEEGYIQGMIIDISDRKKVEKALEEQEKEFRVPFNQAIVGITHMDRNNRFLRFNRKMSDILGYSEKEFSTLGIDDIIYLEDRADVLKSVDRLGEKKIDHCMLEKRCLRKDQSLVWVQITLLAVREEDGTPKYIVLVIEDIERRKWADQTLKQIVEGVSSKTGASFFTSLVTQLASALGIEYAYIGEYMEEEETIKMRAFYTKDKLADNISYRVIGTLSQKVLTNGRCYYLHYASSEFPQDENAHKFGIESYLGLALYDAQNQPIGLIAIMDPNPISDIEFKESLLKIFAVRAASELERQRADDALKQSEANLKAIFNNTQQAFILIGRDGRIQAINRVANLYARWMMNMEIQVGDMFASIIQDEKDREEFAVNFSHALRGHSITIERCVEGRNGQSIWLEINYNPVFEDEIATQVCLSILNINERKQATSILARSEERFRTLIEKSTDFTFILDEGLCVTYQSSSTETVIGYPSGYWIGRSSFDLIHPEDLESVLQVFCQVMKEPEILLFLQLRMLHRDGRWIYIEMTGRNLLHDPNIEGIVINARDITERIVAEQEREKLLRQVALKNNKLQETIKVLQDTQSQLIHSERMNAIGNLVAGVMHEINNPNAAIYAALQEAVQMSLYLKEYLFLLLEDNDRELPEVQKVEEMVKDITSTLSIATDGAERIKSIVSTLRSFTRHQEADHQQGNMAAQIDSTIILFQYQYKNVEVQTEYATTDLTIVGNLGEINQVLLNLFVNGAQAGATRITITVERSDDNMLVVSVSDNGRGMNQRTAQNIFEPFFSTKGTNSMGLGLNITKKILEKHNASIHVESVEGKGTLFTLTFPLADQIAIEELYHADFAIR